MSLAITNWQHSTDRDRFTYEPPKRDQDKSGAPLRYIKCRAAGFGCPAYGRLRRQCGTPARTMAAYAVFLKCCEIVGSLPRRYRTGRIIGLSGEPIDLRQFATLTGFPKHAVPRALADLLVVGWLTLIDDQERSDLESAVRRFGDVEASLAMSEPRRDGRRDRDAGDDARATRERRPTRTNTRNSTQTETKPNGNDPRSRVDFPGAFSDSASKEPAWRQVAVVRLAETLVPRTGDEAQIKADLTTLRRIAGQLAESPEAAARLIEAAEADSCRTARRPIAYFTAWARSQGYQPGGGLMPAEVTP